MNRPQTLFGLILIIIGVSAFLRIDIFRLVIPALLIYLGYRILSGEHRNMNPVIPTKKVTTDLDQINESIIFSGINRQLKSADFKGGALNVIFGGGELDLSQVKTKTDALTLEVNAVFGGLKLILPPDWQIQAETTAVFGGVELPPSPEKPGKTILTLKGAAVFGGISVVRS